MTGSNTATNTHGGKPFVKGDPRINRKGRPKDFDALRELSLQIAHEVATVREKDSGVVHELLLDGHRVTVAEKILRDWARSGDWQRQKGFIEIAFGKVPDEVNVGFNFAKMTDDQLTKFIAGALAAIGAGALGGATAGAADSGPASAPNIPGVHPAG